MKNSSDSEVEFWEDIDHPMDLSMLERAKKTLDDKIAACKKAMKKPYYQEKFQRLLDQARNAYKEKFRNKCLVILNKQAKEYQNQLETMQNAHKKEITDLIKKFLKLDKVLSNRDLQIEDFQRLIIHQEHDLAFGRMASSYKPKKIHPVNLEPYEKEIEALQVQIKSYKELIGHYQKDIENLKKDIENINLTISKNLREYKVKKLIMLGKIEEVKKKCDEEIRKVKEHYEKFKGDVATELELKHVITSRQQEIIGTLKSELICAKAVLDTPRLLFKYNSKMPYKHNKSKSIAPKSIRSTLTSKALLLKKKRFDSKDTLTSTTATHVFSLTPDLDYPSSILPTLSESEYYR